MWISNGGSTTEQIGLGNDEFPVKSELVSVIERTEGSERELKVSRGTSLSAFHFPRWNFVGLIGIGESRGIGRSLCLPGLVIRDSFYSRLPAAPKISGGGGREISSFTFGGGRDWKIPVIRPGGGILIRPGFLIFGRFAIQWSRFVAVANWPPGS